MENANNLGDTTQDSSERLRSILRHLMVGKTANEVADGAGVSPQLLSKILRGHSKRPAYESLRKLATYFGVSVPQLLGHEPLPKDLYMADAYYHPRFYFARLTQDINLDLWRQVPQHIGEETVNILKTEIPNLDFPDLDLDDLETQMSLKMLHYVWLWFRRKKHPQLNLLNHKDVGDTDGGTNGQ